MRGFPFALTGLALLGLASLLVGATNLWNTQLDAGMVLAISRVPRTVAAMLAGAGLALAGVVVQQSVQNRLVDPGLIGTPESAMLGLLAITLIAPGAALLVKMSVASLSALAGTAVFFALARLVPRRDPMLLPLVGLIYGGILGAAAMWLAWVNDLVQFIGIWQTGEFSGVLRGRYELLWIIAALAVALFLLADRITLLGLGCVAVTFAVVVVTVGAMPFVGLVVPNIVSRWRGDNLRRNLPWVALLGAVLVLAADLLGRVVRWPYEIPAATVFAVFGAGLFLWLLNTRKTQAQHG